MCCDTSNCWARDELEDVRELVTRGMDIIRERNLYRDVLRDVQRQLKYGDKKKNRIEAATLKKINEAL